METEKMITGKKVISYREWKLKHTSSLNCLSGQQWWDGSEL